MKWLNPWKSQDVSTFLHRLESEFYNLDSFSADSLNHMKCRLHDLFERSPPKYHKYVNAVIFNINRQLEIRFDDYGKHDHRKHPMSDHAFVRTLELIHGLDIDDLKEKAILDVEESTEYRPLYKDKRIVTILQKGQNDDTRGIQGVV
jgi:hypothetical protein